jgi:hypothetical protein
LTSKGVPYNFETDTLKEVRKPSDYPAGKCYVIQFFSTEQFYHEGDERSRNCPGHGYPAWTETVLSVRQFVTQSEEEWREAIASLFLVDKSRTDMAAIVMERASIQTRVEIKVEA